MQTIARTDRFKRATTPLAASALDMSTISVLMIGAGEYNTGFVPHAAGAAPDKPAGVVGCVLFDLRRRGKIVGRLLLADVDGRRLPLARACMEEKIGRVYRDADTTLEYWPKDESVAFDKDAPIDAMDTLKPGDAVIIFTPDSTHFELTNHAISRGLHVLVAKPLVQKLGDHLSLLSAAAASPRPVIVAVEYHKRWDPIYNDARERARGLGDFSYFYSLMTQRTAQLDTFAAWAGISSDISYYLNSHHIDVLCWILEGRARPETVTASSSTGVAEGKLGRPCEDSITLLTTWRNLASGSIGTAVFTSAWIAPLSDCHTQQGFHYMAHKGELRADQAHRGYAQSTASTPLASLNPLYMRYTPDAAGFFAGQHGYGYRSIESFVDAAAKAKKMLESEGASAVTAEGGAVFPSSSSSSSSSLPSSTASPSTATAVADAISREFGLASAAHTTNATAILDAGRRSLDNGGRPVRIVYQDQEKWKSSMAAAAAAAARSGGNAATAAAAVGSGGNAATAAVAVYDPDALPVSIEVM